MPVRIVSCERPKQVGAPSILGRRSRALSSLLFGTLTVLATPRAASAEQTCAPAGSTCAPSASPAAPGPPASTRGAEQGAPRLVFYWGIGCPHCERARPFVESLAREGVAVERVEVRRDPAGRERLLAEARRLGIAAPGIPLFVVGDRYAVGFRGEDTEAEVRAMIRAAREGPRAPSDAEGGAVELPLVGKIDPHALSLPAFTVLVGLADGLNPCAFYVLVAMLGVLLHVRSRKRLLLFGGMFVVASGIVYFLFMTAWLGIFTLTGLSRGVTIGLGVILLVMGLINLKDVLWFKKGVSLMIPERAKPGLFRRMRAVAGAASLPIALVGVATLAFLVNLVELGCTLGLPAVYTHVLSLRRDLSSAARYAYLALYNVAYVIPLAAIVLVYAATLHRLTLTERRAKVLKGVSGALLVMFGVLFLVAPDALRAGGARASPSRITR